MNAIDGILFREPGAPQGTPPLVLFFEEKAIKDERASRDGPPIFDTVHQVRVVVAGSRGGEGPVYEMWRRKHDGAEKNGEGFKRFGKPYSEWRAGKTPADTGTPLEQWPLMDVAMVATLKASHVYTVQQLADLPDSALDTSIRRGGREWRAKAQAWLEESRSAAGDVEARATIARQQAEIDELKGQVRQLLQKQNTPGYDKRKANARRTTGDDTVLEIADAGELAEALDRL